MKDMKLDVPYLSQLLDVSDTYWTNRACGAVSLAMVLAYHGRPIDDLLAYMTEAERVGGFTKADGWHYRHLARTAEERGLATEFKEPARVEDIVRALDAGVPVIVSVVKRLFGKERGHILVVMGYERTEDGALSGLFYHDPESLYREKGAQAFVRLEDFLHDWKARALFVSRK